MSPFHQESVALPSGFSASSTIGFDRLICALDLSVSFVDFQPNRFRNQCRLCEVLPCVYECETVGQSCPQISGHQLVGLSATLTALILVYWWLLIQSD